MTEHTSLAAYYRRHRQAFLLAQELGITPRAAEAVLRQRDKARRAACGRQAAPASAAEIEPLETPAASTFGEWAAPWMMRD